MGFVHHQTHLQTLRAGAVNKRGQRAGVVVAVSVIALGAPLRTRHALGGGQQHHAGVRFLVAAIAQAARRQRRRVGRQRVFGLLHQRDKRHKPEPQHRALRTHALQHLADDKGFARPRGRAQQTRRRRLAQQGALHALHQAALKIFRLHCRALRGHGDGVHRHEGQGGGRGVHTASPSVGVVAREGAGAGAALALTCPFSSASVSE